MQYSELQPSFNWLTNATKKFDNYGDKVDDFYVKWLRCDMRTSKLYFILERMNAFTIVSYANKI